MKLITKTILLLSYFASHLSLAANENITAVAEMQIKPVYINVGTDLDFGKIKTPDTATTCTLDTDGNLTPIDKCEQTTTATAAVIYLTAQKNSTIQISSTAATPRDGITINLLFGKNADQYTTYTGNIDGSGKLRIVATGTININPDEINTDTKETFNIPISVTYP